LEINLQLSGGVIIPYAVSSDGLFYFKGINGVLNITGQDAGDTGTSAYPSSEISGTGILVAMDNQTDDAELNIDGISLRSNDVVLSLAPGSTGSGDSDIYINNTKIVNYGTTDTPAVRLSGPLYAGIENSSIINQFGDGNPDVGVINMGSKGRLNLINSIVWQKGVNSSTDTSGIAVNIGGSSANQGDHYITLSGNTFYTAYPKNGQVLYDNNASSNGVISVYTNSNNVHNMAPPDTAGSGTFLLNGPGTLTLKYLEPPTW